MGLRGLQLNRQSISCSGRMHLECFIVVLIAKWLLDIPLLNGISLCGTITIIIFFFLTCKPLVRLSTICLQQIFLFQIEIWYLSNTVNCLPRVMNPMKHSKYTFILKVYLSSSILILHYQTVLLMYSIVLHRQPENKCNTCTVCRLLGEGTFVYLAGAEVQTSSPCVKCIKKLKASLW
jgi:hypothetical protein